MDLPEALSTDNPGHAQTIYQAIEASTQSPLEEVRKPAEQLLKACEEIPGYTSVLATIAGTHAADADARAGAVILLKNMVRARWKSRGGRGVVVGDGEKAALRGFLLRSMEEPEARVASQLAVLTGKLARVDWPRQWPELFPSLVTSLVSGGPSRRRMAICGTDEVLKELCMKRVGFDKAAFVKTAADLLPVVCQAWDAQWAAIASLLPTISGRDAIVSKGHSEAAAAVALGTVCVRTVRRLLQFGIPGLEHPNVQPFFQGLLERMAGVFAVVQQYHATARGAGVLLSGTGDGEMSVLEELEELLERMACSAVDAQKDHPIGFWRYLPAHLSFFYEQLSSPACAPAAVSSPGKPGVTTAMPTMAAGDTGYPFGPFLIQCMAFIANVVGCSSYREDVLSKAASSATTSGGQAASSGRPRLVGRLITGKGDAVISPEAVQGITAAMVEFFSADRVVKLLRLLLDRYLPLRAPELDEWVDAPEQYYLLQDSLEARESVRVTGQELYMALLEATDRNVGGMVAATVADMLSRGVSDQIEACRQSAINDQMLAYDALYLCAGLGAYTVKQHFDFERWFQAFLGPALEALVTTMQQVARGPPPILLRRLMWLLGCWAEQIPTSLRPPLVQATANVMKAEEADAVVRLSALNALNSLLSLWDLDPEQCLAPALGWLVPALYGMFEAVEEMESRQQVLTVMSELLDRSGRLLVPHCQAAVAGLPNVWNATASQTPLRCSCLQVMTHVVDALSSGKGPDLDRTALIMVDVATKVGSDEAIYLMDAGLELWLALLRHATDYDGTIHSLFPRIPEMLECDLNNLKKAMLILEAYVLVGGTVFLQAHGPLVCACFRRVVGQVKPQGAAFVSRAMESLLRSFPAEGSRMLANGGVVGQVMESCLVNGGDGSSREPDLVIVQHLTALCRVLLGAMDALQGVLQQTSLSTTVPAQGNNVADGSDRLLAELVTQLTSLFDSAGYSSAGVWRRRLWAMALLKLLPSADGTVVRNLDQIVNICVDVLTEEREDGGKKLQESLGQLATREPDNGTSPQDVLQSRLEKALRADVSVTADLRLLVRESMDALRASLGEPAWHAAVETVEPVILAQLQGLVA